MQFKVSDLQDFLPTHQCQAPDLAGKMKGVGWTTNYFFYDHWAIGIELLQIFILVNEHSSPPPPPGFRFLWVNEPEG